MTEYQCRSSLKHSQYEHKQKAQFPNAHSPNNRTLSCSSELKVGAVRRVASSSASAHVEDIDSRGSEARYHHAGGFGPRWWVAQLLLLLKKKKRTKKQKQIARDDQQKQVLAAQTNMWLHKPIITATFEQNTSFSSY